VHAAALQSNRLLAILPQLAPYTTDAFSFPIISPCTTSKPFPIEPEVPIYGKEHFNKPLKPIKPPDPPSEIPEFTHPSITDSKPQVEISGNTEKMENQEVPQAPHSDRLEVAQAPEIHEVSHNTESLVPNAPLVPKEPDSHKPMVPKAPEKSILKQTCKSQEKSHYHTPKPCPCTPPEPNLEQQKFEREEPESEHEVSTTLMSNRHKIKMDIAPIIIYILWVTTYPIPNWQKPLSCILENTNLYLFCMENRKKFEILTLLFLVIHFVVAPTRFCTVSMLYWASYACVM
jgi:hypothetical protein